MVFVRIFSCSYPLILSSMYTLRHTYIVLSYHLSLTKSGVLWRDAEPPMATDTWLTTLQKELKWLKDSNNYTDSVQLIRALNRIRDEWRKLATRNETQKTAINNEIQKALDDPSIPVPAKIEISKLKDEFIRDFKKAEVANKAAIISVGAWTLADTVALKEESIYNSKPVKWYAHIINLGSALEFLGKQKWTDTKSKAELALQAVKTSQIAYKGSSSEQVDGLSNYVFRSTLTFDDRATYERINSARAIEADKLIDFYKDLAKASPAEQAKLLKAGIESDRKVDPKNIADLIADFDDDGILETINGIDTSSWSKWFFSLFHSADAMQTQFFGEIQLKNILQENLPSITKYLAEKWIVRWKEDDKAWAKRIRNAITIQADMLGTGIIGEKGAESMYTGEAWKANLDKRKEIEQIFSEVEKSLKNGAKVKPEDISKVARQVTDWIIRTQFTLGGGTINLNEIQNIVADPKNASLLAMDYSAMVRLFNSPRLKVNAAAWVSVALAEGKLVPLAHVGVNAKVTFIDRADLESLSKNLEDGKSNITATLGANLITRVHGPAINVDLLWRDRIDQSENAVIHMGAVIDSILEVDATGNPKLNLDKIKDKKMDQSLRDMLALLSAAISDSAVPLKNPNEKMAHAALLRNKFLNAFELYINNHPKMKGVGLAGLSFVLTPGAFALWPVVQNVGTRREPVEIKVWETVTYSSKPIDTIKEARNIHEHLLQFGLAYNEKTGKIQQEREFKPDNVKLVWGLAWDTTTTSLVIDPNYDPIFSIDEKDGKKVLTIGKSDTPRVMIDVPIAAVAPKNGVITTLKEMPKVPWIDALDLNILLTDKKVLKFMEIMTNTGSTLDQKMVAAKAVPQFSAILDQATFTQEIPDSTRQKQLSNLLDAIDAKFIGDWITRMYNYAKVDDWFFNTYVARLKKLGVTDLPSDKKDLKLSHIASVSFDKTIKVDGVDKKLRQDDADRIATFLWTESTVTAGDLIAADGAMLKTFNAQDNFQTAWSGLTMMSRNRLTGHLQWVRTYLDGSYLMKTELSSLTIEKKIHIIEKMIGWTEWVRWLIKAELLNSTKYLELQKYANQITVIAAKEIKFDPNWIAEISLKDNQKLKIDISGFRVYSALFGNTGMNNSEHSQACCVNLGLYADPSFKAEVTQWTRPEPQPKLLMTSQTYTKEVTPQLDTVFRGTAVYGQATILWTIARWWQNKTDWTTDRGDGNPPPPNPTPWNTGRNDGNPVPAPEVQPPPQV